MPTEIGERIINEIIRQGMVNVSAPDPEVQHVITWNGNAIEQLTALVENHYRKPQQKLTANTHPLCKLCERAPKEGCLTYYSDAWCYMFRDGEHVLPGGQGWCAQFTQDKAAISRQLKTKP